MGKTITSLRFVVVFPSLIFPSVSHFLTLLILLKSLSRCIRDRKIFGISNNGATLFIGKIFGLFKRDLFLFERECVTLLVSNFDTWRLRVKFLARGTIMCHL
jgi:hypothetical protein